jgi:hypothetical protein
VFNATFSIISAISLRPVLVMEEAGAPGENHRPWPGQAIGKLYPCLWQVYQIKRFENKKFQVFWSMETKGSK